MPGVRGPGGSGMRAVYARRGGARVTLDARAGMRA